MILNFYLRKHPSKGEMRTVEKQNLANVRALLKKRGVPNASRLDYHAAIQTLAKQVAGECAGKHGNTDLKGSTASSNNTTGCVLRTRPTP